MSTVTVTLVCVHFGDKFWVENLIKQTVHLTQIERIIVCTKDNIKFEFENLDKIEILRIDKPNKEHASFDHADAISEIQKLEFNSSHIMLIDTDIIGLNEDSLAYINTIMSKQNCILAVDPSYRWYTHPCFMFLEKTLFQSANFTPELLTFSEKQGIRNLLIDTGRQIGISLARQNLSVRLVHSSKFQRWLPWDFYWELGVIHMKSRSFTKTQKGMNRSVELSNIYDCYCKWFTKQYSHKPRKSGYFQFLKFIFSSDLRKMLLNKLN